MTNLRDVCYDLLREEQNSSAYPYTLVDLMLNSSQQRICNWRVVNPLTKEEVRKGQLSFLNSNKFYSNIQPTSLSADTTVWATSLSVVDASSFDSTWTLYIGGNIITYTWTTSTSFTWVTGVLFAFEAWKEVSVAYALPTDFASAITITYNDKIKLEAKQFDDIFEELNDYKWNTYSRNRSEPIYESPYRINPFYTIIDNAYLVVFQLNDTGSSIFLRYEKKATTLSAVSDTATISDDIYAKTTIPYLAVWEVLFNRWEENRAKEIINFAVGQIREMYAHYNTASFEKISGKQYRIGKWKGLNI